MDLFIGVVTSELGHHHTDVALFRAASGDNAADLAAAEHEDTVGELKQNIQILTDEYNRDTFFFLCVQKVVYYI